MRKAREVTVSLVWLVLLLMVAGSIVKMGADLGGSSWLGIPFFVKLAAVMEPVFRFTIGDLVSWLVAAGKTIARWSVPTLITLFGLVLGIAVSVDWFSNTCKKLRQTATS